jgi:hypothetical protein
MWYVSCITETIEMILVLLCESLTVNVFGKIADEST